MLRAVGSTIALRVSRPKDGSGLLGPATPPTAFPAGDGGPSPEHSTDREGDRTVNLVLLTGRLTRDPEIRSLASGKNVTTFAAPGNEFVGGRKEKSEYRPVVA